jgi:diguanylate cyclase (GGDEF)-like protein
MTKNLYEIDELTNCYNRRYLRRLYSEKSIKIKRIAMIDIVNFKECNEKYYSYGDFILEAVGKYVICYFSQNKSARVIRWGGDEFVIIYFGKDVLDFENAVAALNGHLSVEMFNFIGKSINVRSDVITKSFNLVSLRDVIDELNQNINDQKKKM